MGRRRSMPVRGSARRRSTRLAMARFVKGASELPNLETASARDSTASVGVPRCWERYLLLASNISLGMFTLEGHSTAHIPQTMQ